jgi:hypothetical protein
MAAHLGTGPYFVLFLIFFYYCLSHPWTRSAPFARSAQPTNTLVQEDHRPPTTAPHLHHQLLCKPSHCWDNCNHPESPGVSSLLIVLHDLVLQLLRKPLLHTEHPPHLTAITITSIVIS